MAQSFSLKILVAKEENKVILAESDRDFVDVLFSFMVMPIGRVIRLTDKCSSGDIGCLSNLYGNVGKLDSNFLESQKSQEILLNPRSAAEIYCHNLKLNLIQSGSSEFYVCQNMDCNVISYYQIGGCRCGLKLKHKLTMPSNLSYFPEEKGVFLKSTARFMITDDLQVTPMSAMTGLPLLRELGNYGKTEERTIQIGSDEVLKLLKCSLQSMTPLSDTFLDTSLDKPSIEVCDMKYVPRGMNPLPKACKKGKVDNISLRLIFDKVNNIALYAKVKEDFVNLLCTFLTIPLGYIFYQFPCLSFEGCMGNLHKSIQDTQPNLFCCEARKEILVNPKLAPGLGYNGHLVGIKEAMLPSKCSVFSSLLSAKKRSFYNPKIGEEKQKVGDGFIEGPSMFMVMDNMEVKPLSPIFVKQLVDNSLVPLSDIEEREVILGGEEALRLLVASLVSEHALTNVFLLKERNIVCFDFLQLMWGGKGY